LQQEADSSTGSGEWRARGRPWGRGIWAGDPTAASPPARPRMPSICRAGSGPACERRRRSLNGERALPAVDNHTVAAPACARGIDYVDAHDLDPGDGETRARARVYETIARKPNASDIPGEETVNGRSVVAGPQADEISPVPGRQSRGNAASDLPQKEAMPPRDEEHRRKQNGDEAQSEYAGSHGVVIGGARDGVGQPHELEN